MKILNLLATGRTGGIEVLCRNIMLTSKEDNRICFMFDEGEIYSELKNKLGEKKVLSTKNLNHNTIKIANFIEKYCIKEKIDIIIMHHGELKNNIIYLLLIKKLPNVKFVRYLHGCFDNKSFGNEGNFIKRKLVKIVMNKALKKSDLIIYISRAVKNSFEKVFNIKNKNNLIIYNGIPDKFFNVSRKVKSDKNIINIGFVGRLEDIKGVNVLIDAFAKVYANYHNVKLIITGNGREEANLKKMVDNYHINNAVRFTGRKNDIIPILDEINIFAYPSICEEGFRNICYRSHV